MHWLKHKWTKWEQKKIPTTYYDKRTGATFQGIEEKQTRSCKICRYKQEKKVREF